MVSLLYGYVYVYAVFVFVRVCVEPKQQLEEIG